MGARRVLLPAIVLVTVGIFAFANSHSFGMLLLSQACIAFGACTGFVGAGYVGGTWFGWAKFSFMFGLVQFSASLFSAFNQNLLSWALSVTAWRPLFNYVAGSGVVLFVVALLWLRDARPVIASSTQGFGSFLVDVFHSLAKVSRVPHVWVAAAFGALCFGVMLALGVAWAPKIMAIRGMGPEAANLASSLLWLGLAVGCFIAPSISDRLRRRKLPTLVGIAIQILSLALLLYLPSMGTGLDMLLCFTFGLGNAAHMLAFSTAADVVEPQNIGTSAAIVNGIMFILGGIMISRPGLRVGAGLELGVRPGSPELAQFAARPLMIGVCLAFVIALLMRETYPKLKAPE
jgi:MFS family permease